MWRKLATMLAIFAGLLFLSSGPGLGHHSVAANFDQSKTLDVTGKVKKFAIPNPHSEITLEVARTIGASGTTHACV
jgi:hypothetical protein